MCSNKSLLLLLLAAVFSSVRQTNGDVPIDLPTPTGPYSVGRESFHWIDLSRTQDGTADKNDRRELMVHVWYPAKRSSKTSVAPYIPNLELVKAELDSSQFTILRSVRTHSLVNAKLSVTRSRYPIIILSHGNQMNGFLYTAIIEDLASHGYVVAAIDHPYEAIFTVFPDGRVAKYSEERLPAPNSPSFREGFNNRAVDITFVVTQLSRMSADKDSQFHGRLDLAHIGVLGHSSGGIAAAQACHLDKRIRGCVNLDGRAEGRPFYLNSNGTAPEQPFMYLAKPLRELTDEELAKEKMTRDQFERGRTETLNRENELMRSVKSGGYRVTIRGASHQSFSDEPLLLWTNEKEKIANQKRMQIVREYVRTFFDKYLRNTKAAMLDGPLVPYPEVTVERFGVTKR